MILLYLNVYRSSQKKMKFKNQTSQSENPDASNNTLSFISIGITKAIVFPEPVGAHAKHSRP